MKTTVNIRDDIFRKAKARAALDGKPLSRFLEEALDRVLTEDVSDASSWTEWAESLPNVSSAAIAELDDVLSDDDFRSVDPEMWK